VTLGTALKKDSPYKVSVVKELCPLTFLPLFNVVWYFLPDMMHIVPAIMKGHLMPLMKGLRYPAQPKARTSWSQRENDSLQADWRAAKSKIST
jgi:hypothetical protein